MLLNTNNNMLKTTAAGEVVAWKGASRGAPWSADVLVTLTTPYRGATFRLVISLRDVMSGDVDGSGDLPHKILAFGNAYETRGDPPLVVRESWTATLSRVRAWLAWAGASHDSLTTEAVREAKRIRASQLRPRP